MIPRHVWPWIPAALAAGGAFLLIRSAGRYLGAAFRRRPALPPGRPVWPAPWGPPVAAWALLGLSLLHVLGCGTAQCLGLLAGGVPWLWRWIEARRKRRRIRGEAGDLVRRWRYALLAGAAPDAALFALLAGGQGGLLGATLRAHRDRPVGEGAASLLQEVAEALESPELEILAECASTARDGAHLAAALQALAVDWRSQ